MNTKETPGVEYFTCKCGHETEAPADESTKCPMCGRVGCWDPAPDSEEE